MSQVKKLLGSAAHNRKTFQCSLKSKKELGVTKREMQREVESAEVGRK